MSKIVVTGCCGLLGQKVVSSLAKHSVIGFDLVDSYLDPEAELEYHRTDISDEDNLKEAINEYNPDLIINCAGATDVDGCEKNKGLAYMVNVSGVETLVENCAEKNIRLIQISTDYVFNGKDGPYSEDAEPDPLGYYGITKLNAERIVMKKLKDYVILRTNVLYGTGLELRPNFVHWVIKKLQIGRPVRIVTDQHNNPTLADNLADAIAELVEIDFCGILHFGGKDYVSRFKFAGEIADVFSLNADLILSSLTEELQQAAPRPQKGGLKTQKAEKLLKTKPISIEEGLKIFKEQLAFQLANQNQL